MDRVEGWAGAVVEDVAPHCIDGSLARTLAQTQTQTQAQTHAQAQGPRGTGLRQGKALQSPGKKKGNVVENARLKMKN